MSPQKWKESTALSNIVTKALSDAEAEAQPSLRCLLVVFEAATFAVTQAV
ncbi:hypothetical protein LEMLEM_LOCUS26233, partial [Lemmus lemmus]